MPVSATDVKELATREYFLKIRDMYTVLSTRIIGEEDDLPAPSLVAPQLLSSVNSRPLGAG